MADLVTLSQVREHLQKAAADTASDTLLTTLIARASAAVEQWTQRTLASLGGSASTKRFAVTGTHVDLVPFDLRAVTSVTLHPESTSPVTLTANVGYTLHPTGATTAGTYLALTIADDVALTSDYQARFGHCLLDVSATWGPTATPADVQHATLLAVAAWYRRRIAGSGVIGTIEETTDVVENLPPDARSILGPYRRMVAR